MLGRLNSGMVPRPRSYETRLNNPRFRHVRWGALTVERHRAWAKPRAQLAYLARVWRNRVKLAYVYSTPTI
jgi:hypothetical protein